MNRKRDMWLRITAARAFLRGLWLMILLLGFVSAIEAAIVPTGNVDPGLPWDNYTFALIGNTSDGSLTVNDGSLLESMYAYIGYKSGVSGTVTVTGTGSKWINNYFIHVGYEGGGTLTVTDGGEVTAGTLYASLKDLKGNGTITTQGAVLDADFRFDAVHGNQAIITFGSGGTLKVNAAGGDLGVGYKETGSLAVTGGVTVTSYTGFLGRFSGSTGTATVSGAGSKWINDNYLYVGKYGNGTLTIAAGAEVRSSSGYVGMAPGSTGIATVTGAGSKWTNSSTLYIGESGNGTLLIEAGAQVSNYSSYLGFEAGSTGTATVTGAGSKWVNFGRLYVGENGSGTLTVVDGGEVTAGTLYASLEDLQGNGTITTQGAVLDADLQFDAANGNQATFAFGSGGTLKIKATVGDLGVGYKAGTGSLTVSEGVAITSSSGYLGYESGSTGTATVTGAGSKWTNSSDLYVGRFGIGTLTIEAGAQVSNKYGYLGSESGSTGTATVTGAGSKWTNSNDLYVGRLGSGTLTVADGGEVTAGTLYASLDNLHGNGTITATKGAVLDADLRFDAAHPTQATVTFGSGGTLKVNAAGGALGVGYKGGSGSLTLAEGVAITSSSGYLGYESGSTSTATITGAGSKWTNSSDLYVGRSGSGTLTIEAGAEVSNSAGYLGMVPASTGTATVTGIGSKWTNSNYLYVGRSGSGTLIIEAGALVSNTVGSLGYDSGSTGTATVSGAGSKWTNLGEFSIGRSGSGTLAIEAGAQVSNYSGCLGYESGSTGTATITGSGSKWTNSRDLYVGRSGNGTLTIEAGAEVSNKWEGFLGNESGSTGTATVTGAGSKWTNSSDLYVGRSGSGTLTIEAGAEVSNSSGCLGFFSGSMGMATVTGAGSRWTNSSDLYVGRLGNGTLTVANGGEVTAGTLYASLDNLQGNGSITATQGAVLDADLRFDAAHPTQATVTFGSGGTLKVNAAGGNLGVGYKGGNGSLTVAEGVAITSSFGYLGYYSGTVGTATITGAGSKWINSGDLYVGLYGSGTLTIEAGAQVSNKYGYLGSEAGSTGAATVTGTGSKWTNSYDFYVGRSGSGKLTIEAGAEVSSNWEGYLGYNSGSMGTVTVTGAGSKWTNYGDLYVGRLGSGTLTVADGGEVTAKILYASLGNLYGDGTITATQGAVLDADLRFDAAHGTPATLTFGSGGTLKVNFTEGTLGLGYKGNGSLTVAEGVALTSSYGYLGYNSGTTGTATVTGAGSKWTNSGWLYVGRSGNGTLTIEAGAQVSNSSGWLGYNSGSMGTVTVTGTGSKWTNNGTLFVGHLGNGTLTIEAGAEVSNSYGYVGFNSGSTGTVTVTGAGSKWTNYGDLYVGQLDNGTLTAADGGEVTVGTLYASLDNLHGDGTITATQGAVLDADLRFDAAHGTPATLTFGSGGILKVNFTDETLGVGYKGSGSLTVIEGTALASSYGYLGYNSGSTGTATVTGAGSKWTNSSDLYVGRYGSGTLTIEAGAEVSNSWGRLGYEFGSLGAVLARGTGSKWTNSHPLRVGERGSGTLTIEAGAQVSNSYGYVGDYSGSTGTVTVSGAGSKWTNSSNLYVGYHGSGALTIEANAEVINYIGYLGYASGSTGTALVTGIGSKWNNSSELYVGRYSYKGTLHIRNGGNVLSSSLSINSNSLFSIDAGYGSEIRVDEGTGTITNNGKVRILAGPGPAAGSQFSPIAAATWSGSGTYQALGGLWNETTHAFTVSPSVSGVSGMPLAIKLNERQRVLIEDSLNGWEVGASFLAKTGTATNVSFTATAVGGDGLAELRGVIDSGQTILSAWNFAATGTGYSSADPVYLSFAVEEGYARNDLRLWSYDGAAWKSYSADDLTCHDGYASFTVTGLSSYAIAAVPEPSMLVLLVCCAGGSIAMIRRRRG